jgi:hypothetical protein
MNKNYFLKYIKILFILISFFFIYENSKENYQEVLNKLNFEYLNIFFSIGIIIVMQNLLNLRSFSFLRITSNYNASFSEWSILFYLTGLINQSPFWGAGHVIRSYEMKKNNYSHKEYLNMYIFIFFWGALIYSLLLISLSFFFSETSFYTLLVLSTLSTISLIVTSKITLKYCKIISEKINSYKVVKKIKLFDFLLKEFSKLFELSNLISQKKLFINFFIFTILLFCFEFLLLNIIFKFFFQNIEIKIIFLFFLLNFLIRVIKPVDNIIGIKESLLGMYSQHIGLLFVEGALIVIIMRLLSLVSLILNFIFYYSIKTFFN